MFRVAAQVSFSFRRDWWSELSDEVPVIIVYKGIDSILKKKISKIKSVGLFQGVFSYIEYLFFSFSNRFQYP